MAKPANPATQVTLPSDREVRVTRSFNAPRQLVFDAHTKPELVKQWMWGPDEWPLVTCEIDLRVGGRIRYVWKNEEKGEMGLSGEFREIDPPARLVHTELFDEDWTGGEAVVTTLFEEKGGRTTVVATVLYASREVRDSVVKTGMADGWSQCFDRLDELLPRLQG